MEKTIRPLLNVCFVAVEPRDTEVNQPSSLMMFPRFSLFAGLTPKQREKRILNMWSWGSLTVTLILFTVYLVATKRTLMEEVKYGFWCNTTENFCVRVDAYKRLLSNEPKKEYHEWFKNYTCTTDGEIYFSAMIEQDQMITNVKFSHNCKQPCACYKHQHAPFLGWNKYTWNAAYYKQQFPCPKNETLESCPWVENDQNSTVSLLLSL